MQISQYIVVKQSGHSYYKKYTSRLTKGSPALAANEVAVKVTIELPDEIFEKPSLQANIVVPKEAVSKPVIEASVIDNVEQIIKQNTGFEVRLEVVDKDDEAEEEVLE